MRLSFQALGFLLACSATVVPVVLAQQGSGVKYRVSSKMEMVGMPFAMPARTTEVCGPKNAAAESLVPRQDNCRVLDYRVTGNKSSFRVVCTGKDAMTGTGEFEMLGANGYRGKMTMATDGEQMIMSFDGKRLGDCDYAKEGPQAQVNEMMAKTCGEMLKESGAGLILVGTQFTAAGGVCLPQKAAYCRKLTPLANDLKLLRDTEASQAAIRQQGGVMPTQWDSFQGCGLSRTSILTKNCAKADSIGDYDFISALCPERLAAACSHADPSKGAHFLVDHCPARAEQLAAEQCAGRGYTALSTSPYRDFCNAYAGARLQQRNEDGGGSKPAKPGEPAPKKPSFRERLKGLKLGVSGG